MKKAIPDGETETLLDRHRLNVWTDPPSESARYNISAQGGYPGLFQDLERKADCQVQLAVLRGGRVESWCKLSYR